MTDSKLNRIALEEVQLEKFRSADFERLMGWSGDPEFLMQWAGPSFKFPLDERQLKIYLRTATGSSVSRKIWKAVIPSREIVFGHVELSNIDWRNETATLARVLIGDASLRGQGLGSAMVSRVLDYGFKVLELHRIDLFVFDENVSAIECYKNLGFVKEGHLKEARKLDDKRLSLYQMRIFARDWVSPLAG